MTHPDFDALRAAGYTHAPLARRVLADLDTPLSAYRKLAAGPFSFLFESVHGGEKWGRYSIIGLPARARIEVTGRRVRHIVDDTEVETAEIDDPLAWVDAFAKRMRVAPREHLPRFTGGLVGYFGYDVVRYIEPRLAAGTPPDTLGCPDIVLLVSDEVLVFDNLSGHLHLIVLADLDAANGIERARARLEELISRLDEPVAHAARPAAGKRLDEADFVSAFTREGYEAAVGRIKDYIVDGDVMQVVLAQRMSVPFAAPPVDLYRALRSLNPSPYMFFMDLGAFQIVGSSPEILVRLEGDIVTVRPIAGTRPRGRDNDEDLALEQELLADPKERAEHLMRIDLGRNDVGRVAEIGSVRVTEQMVIERYSHVMHIVSNVEARIGSGLDAMDTLRATFPAGTVSGAPKVRAMEIIDELEPVKRGVYAGAVGYLGWNGDMDTAIAIRTAVIRDGRLYIEAGAGIVADSVPAREWDETMNKGRAIFRAAALAVSGLRLED